MAAFAHRVVPIMRLQRQHPPASSSRSLRPAGCRAVCCASRTRRMRAPAPRAPHADAVRGQGAPAWRFARLSLPRRAMMPLPRAWTRPCCWATPNVRRTRRAAQPARSHRRAPGCRTHDAHASATLPALERYRTGVGFALTVAPRCTTTCGLCVQCAYPLSASAPGAGATAAGACATRCARRTPCAHSWPHHASHTCASSCSYWGFGKEYGKDASKEAFDVLAASGLTFIDTAEARARASARIAATA
jgi:hypothetical protein